MYYTLTGFPGVSSAGVPLFLVSISGGAAQKNVYSRSLVLFDVVSGNKIALIGSNWDERRPNRARVAWEG